MIGCDNCQDWYHSTCLGLSKAPEVPQWFCPKCSQKPLPSTNSLLSKGSSHGSLNSSRPNVKHSAREPGSKNPKYKPKR
nr:SJCHGC03802 protein [Schistosoma japonicum]